MTFDETSIVDSFANKQYNQNALNVIFSLMPIKFLSVCKVKVSFLDKGTHFLLFLLNHEKIKEFGHFDHPCHISANIFKCPSAIDNRY